MHAELPQLQLSSLSRRVLAGEGAAGLNAAAVRQTDFHEVLNPGRRPSHPLRAAAACMKPEFFGPTIDAGRRLFG